MPDESETAERKLLGERRSRERGASKKASEQSERPKRLRLRGFGGSPNGGDDWARRKRAALKSTRLPTLRGGIPFSTFPLFQDLTRLTYGLTRDY